MKSRYFLFCCVLICSAYGFSFIRDDDPLKNLLSKLEKFKDEYPQEKVHIHTDKPYYSVGDSIWFKAYIVNAEQNELSNLSKILYVELINEKDSIKASLRLPVIAGLAWGDFTLTDSLTEGNYRLRAYTNWMRNFGEEYYFDKVIKIGSSFANKVIGNVSYSFTKVGTKENVSAVIVYSDIDGEPFANKEVSYNIELDSRNVAKGKGLTDAQGRLAINFVNSQPFILKSGKISTTLKLDEKTVVSKVFPVKATSADVDVQFFPEGGQMVSGLRSKIAFKAVGADGRSTEISGRIVDKDNKPVTEFKSEHAGMGFFSLLPEQGNTYTAIVKFTDGSEKQLQLPSASASGYVLAVGNNHADNILVRISASPDLLEKGPLTLVAQSNGVVKFAARNSINKGAISAYIPKKRFPTGILQLTLFSPSYEPVAERLVFIKNDETLKLNISTDKTSYARRQKVNMTVNVVDTAGKPVVGNFSVAVTNESKIPFNDEAETTILSNLLLSSDLKGYIENPNYYFTEANDEKNGQLDNLLLTQGWRRFTWKSLMANSFPNLAFKPEQGLSISGRVKTFGGKPVVGGKVTLLASRGSMMLLDTVTDAEGRFAFDNLSFTDSTRVVIQARNAKDKKNVDIEIDRVPPQLVTRSKNYPDIEVNINSTLLSYLKSRNQDIAELKKHGMFRRNIMLEEVKIVERRPEVRNSSNLNGAGHADQVIKADRLQNCTSLEQCLQGLAAGVIIQGGIAYSTRSMNTPMQLIVDGMPMEPDLLSMINPSDVESIEVLRTIGNTAIYGMRGGGGVLIINTKRGDPNYSIRTYVPGITTYSPQGYYIARQFYMPNYDKPETSKELPDLRNTVFWTPNILTDSTGKASFQFFTTGEGGTYKVVTEGLDGKGGIARQVVRFVVK
ncbi:carboxypeptidase-like regulatory domain-containing protein [Arcticibacter tournemirensis]|uniref:TonB-dependent receptor n=1 Tax=Arcticibacter tournemirensis TaxID=699437 RepID=A0A4V1KHH2_9SPHI|nr:carboxypeptidase-like regulatory domain-containing protein [Arcticibacter tournemirensis]RXF67182.1 TonB-dependent receptor [Arcticibacter tournemirensis]